VDFLRFVLLLDAIEKDNILFLKILSSQVFIIIGFYSTLGISFADIQPRDGRGLVFPTVPAMQA